MANRAKYPTVERDSSIKRAVRHGAAVSIERAPPDRQRMPIDLNAVFRQLRPLSPPRRRGRLRDRCRRPQECQSSAPCQPLEAGRSCPSTPRWKRSRASSQAILRTASVCAAPSTGSLEPAKLRLELFERQWPLQGCRWRGGQSARSGVHPSSSPLCQPPPPGRLSAVTVTLSRSATIAGATRSRR